MFLTSPTGDDNFFWTWHSWNFSGGTAILLVVLEFFWWCWIFFGCWNYFWWKFCFSIIGDTASSDSQILI